MPSPEEQLKQAERGPRLSILIYLVLAGLKLSSAHFLQSASLQADGLNNLTDILGNLAVLIGLRLARKPADGDHKFGHWKIEDLASLITSFIMFVLGFQMLFAAISLILTPTSSPIDPLGAVVGVLSAIIMLTLYHYNKKLSKRYQSGALLAAAKDNLTDAVTSLGTSLAIIASQFRLPVLDLVVALLISLFILKTAYEIFSTATFSLSDGFDDQKLLAYEQAILQLPKITAVKSQRGRHYGANVYLDLVLEMNPDLSVYESHAITEQVEQLLSDQFGVYDIDIHVEPAPLPEDEVLDFLLAKLQSYEEAFLTGHLVAERFASDFRLISADAGHEFSTTSRLKELDDNWEDFHFQSISQKTKLLTYRLKGRDHTSLWRRHEDWQLVYHQIS